ncbi:MAG: tetratricopeptide repeat protein, partial [Deltaproteobacteria bacterium]|nr:tetratricopeptide repeat protein [Deltaproteobacteria bacterium]
RITKVRHAIEETREVIAASAGAPYLPELQMRLAELISEEARYHYMVAREREQGRAETLHIPQVRILKEQSIATYRMLLVRYPDFHLADRVLFSIGQELRELGEFEEMRTTLEQLVKAYPDSPYRSEALLILGDFHFDKAEFAPAARYYQQIVAHGQPQLLGLAYYKLAWVHVNVGDCPEAFREFEAAMEASRAVAALHTEEAPPLEDARVEGEFAVPASRTIEDLVGDYGTLDVQREALVDLTYCYAQVRKPEEAAAYLRGQAATREAYVAALSKMAGRFALIEQPQGAAEVTRELLRLAPGVPCGGRRWGRIATLRVGRSWRRSSSRWPGTWQPARTAPCKKGWSRSGPRSQLRWRRLRAPTSPGWTPSRTPRTGCRSWRTSPICSWRGRASCSPDTVTGRRRTCSRRGPSDAKRFTALPSPTSRPWRRARRSPASTGPRRERGCGAPGASTSRKGVPSGTRAWPSSSPSDGPTTTRETC